ncbi:MAG: hypothetical protein E7591_02960 [Ruminococcaceae bacterium]|nr:hypothetical protein [Oscillospiraceae bacterium]
MTLVEAVKTLTELAALIGILTPVVISIKRVSCGTKCQLRSEMLKIYYRNKGDLRIRQYEYENFVLLYQAYKSLGGNSFIDKIYSEIKEMEIVS